MYIDVTVTVSVPKVLSNDSANVLLTPEAAAGSVTPLGRTNVDVAE